MIKKQIFAIRGVRLATALAILVAGVLAVHLATSPALAGAPGSPSAVVSAESLLLKALAADRRFDYAGTQVLFTWASGSNEATAIQVYHDKGGATKWEYFGSGRNPYLVVVDNGTHRWHYQPGEKLMSISLSTKLEAEESVDETFDLLRRNYHLQRGGQGEVAGRATDIVELLPKDCGHVAQRLWIDRESGVTLRTEKYRLDGSIASMSIFNEFALSPRFKAEEFKLTVPRGTRVVDDSHIFPRKDLEKLRERGIPLHVPETLPAGYEFMSGAIMRPGDTDVVHLRFTDGLNVISLFEQPAKPGVQYVVKGAKRITLKNGSGYLYEECSGYLLNWTAGGTNFTLVGEVPSEVLVELAGTLGTSGPVDPVTWVRNVMRRLFDR